MSEPTLYLFDGSNLFHAGSFGTREELVDVLASYLALRGARGVVVFDGAGEERSIGPLAIRFARHADDLLERLAAEHRRAERVRLVSSDRVLRSVSGREVEKVASRLFLAELLPTRHREQEGRGTGGRLGERLDEATRARLERLRRGEADEG
ncbi:MAG: NYN domain-containing protein [Thermoleophilia bacterium]|nr:NYN domain-containing protein [Thermoleophilia bacterium]